MFSVHLNTERIIGLFIPLEISHLLGLKKNNPQTRENKICLKGRKIEHRGMDKGKWRSLLVIFVPTLMVLLTTALIHEDLTGEHQPRHS